MISKVSSPWWSRQGTRATTGLRWKRHGDAHSWHGQRMSASACLFCLRKIKLLQKSWAVLATRLQVQPRKANPTALALQRVFCRYATRRDCLGSCCLNAAGCCGVGRRAIWYALAEEKSRVMAVSNEPEQLEQKQNVCVCFKRTGTTRTKKNVCVWTQTFSSL